jgi:hypothetical protein
VIPRLTPKNSTIKNLVWQMDAYASQSINLSVNEC